MDIDVFRKGVSILPRSWYPSDMRASLRAGKSIVQRDHYFNNSIGFFLALEQSG